MQKKKRENNKNSMTAGESVIKQKTVTNKIYPNVTIVPITLRFTITLDCGVATDVVAVVIP